MQSLEQQFKVYVANLRSLLEQLEPIHWAAIGGFFLLLLIIRIIRGISRRNKLRKIAPNLNLHAFQVAPLGRDAYFKVGNNGEQATLSELNIKGRSDISIKNAVAGHQLEKDKVYGILLEAESTTKINTNFTIELTYMDRNGNVYRQLFLPNQQLTKSPKLVKVTKW